MNTMLTSDKKRASKRKKLARRPAGTAVQTIQHLPQEALLIQKARQNPGVLSRRDILQLQRLAGNKAINRLQAGSGPAADSRVIQRDGGILDFIKRFLGISTQQEGADLPEMVYRIDERAPLIVSREGFQPWKPGGNISIEEHVSGGLKGKRTPMGLPKPAKHESQFVSTSAYQGLAGTLRFAQGKYFYKIDTGFQEINKSDFTDVNDYFRRKGIFNPYPDQLEWIKKGGIPGAAVTHYMEGKDFQDQCVNNGGKLPDESSLTGWKEMPPPLLRQPGQLHLPARTQPESA